MFCSAPKAAHIIHACLWLCYSMLNAHLRLLQRVSCLLRQITDSLAKQHVNPIASIKCRHVLVPGLWGLVMHRLALPQPQLPQASQLPGPILKGVIPQNPASAPP